MIVKAFFCIWVLLCTAIFAFQSSSFLHKHVAVGIRSNYAFDHHNPMAFDDGNCTAVAAGETIPSSSLLISSQQRRSVLFGVGLFSSLMAGGNDAWAGFQFGRRGKQSSLFFINPNPDKNVSALGSRLSSQDQVLTSEFCLLKLLPVKNPVFRQLEKDLESLSSLRSATASAAQWESATDFMLNAIITIDTKRNLLEPVFNPDDSATLQVFKAERGEQLIESLRTQIVDIVNATRTTRNITEIILLQKQARLTLADVGGQLVPAYPYDVPKEGKFSYLPRLLGRAQVTFTFRRRGKILGNMTVVADGFLGENINFSKFKSLLRSPSSLVSTDFSPSSCFRICACIKTFPAPITAGNFVDLSLRNFYTGLPIKLARKKVGSGGDFEVATLPILGSFQEGFYDPLTAKLRRIPLEIIRLDKAGRGAPQLSYAEEVLSPIDAQWDFSDRPASVASSGTSLLSFDIPGLVALNHPDKVLNGGSSEFFALQLESLPESKRCVRQRLS